MAIRAVGREINHGTPYKISDEQIIRLVNIFSRGVREFEGPNSKFEGGDAIEEQNTYHRQYFEILLGLSPHVRNALVITDALNEIYEKYVAKIIEDTKYDEARREDITIFGSNNNLPILNEETISELRVEFGAKAADYNFEDVLEVIAILLGTYLRALRSTQPPLDLALTGELRTPLEFAIARIESVVAADHVGSLALPRISQFSDELAAARKRIEDSVVEARKLVGDLRTDLHQSVTDAIVDARKQVGDTISELKERIDSLSHDARAAQQVVLQVSNDFDRVKGEVTTLAGDLNDRTNAADARISALNERISLKSYTKLWADRSQQAWWAFFGSAIVLVLLLAVVPAYVIFVQHDGMLRFLGELANAAAPHAGPDSGSAQIAAYAITRLAIVTIPFFLYVWLIRLVVRFVTRSLLLLDDARSRQTMVDTYIELVERAAATKEDRAIVLASLVRPPPGHGNDTVDPPSFTEALGALGRQSGS